MNRIVKTYISIAPVQGWQPLDTVLVPRDPADQSHRDFAAHAVRFWLGQSRKMQVESERRGLRNMAKAWLLYGVTRKTTGALAWPG